LKRTPDPRLTSYKPLLKVEVDVWEERKNWDFFNLLLASPYYTNIKKISEVVSIVLLAS
jgi:hypothetical protein